MEDQIEIVRFVQPVDFNTELEKAAAIAVACALIGAGVSMAATYLKIRIEHKAAKKLMREIEEMKNQPEE